MAPVSILKTPAQKRSVSFDENGVTSCRYFDLTSDEIYARGRRMKITKHFRDVFGLLPTTTSKIREASKEEAVPFDPPPEPETIIPCENPGNKLERQNANPFDTLYDHTVITANQPIMILPAYNFEIDTIRICELVLKDICEMNYNDIVALMSLKEEPADAQRSQNHIPKNLEDRVVWRRMRNIVHLS